METIQLRPLPKEYYDFMSMEEGIAKNAVYYKEMVSRQFIECHVFKKEGNTYFAVNAFVVKKSKNSFYLKNVKKDGMTINEKGKVSIWFNKTIYNFPLMHELYNYYNFNWLNSKLYPFLTKSTLEKMIAGKITNSLEVVAAYFKSVRIKLSPALFMKIINQENSSGLNKEAFLRDAYVAKDVDNMMKYFYLSAAKDRYDISTILHDMVQEALILGEKIDFKWSLNKLKEVHKHWTRKIMSVELETMKDEPIPNVNKFDRYTPKRFKLLKTKKEVFYEGSTMDHCVYTAYWNSMQRGSYLAYHIKLGAEEATLGVYVTPGSKDHKITFNQCYSKRNKKVSGEMTILVNDFVKHLNEQVIRDGIVQPQEELELELI